MTGNSKNLFTRRRGGAERPPRLRVSACKTYYTATILKLFVAFALVLPVAACGTKTELLMPNGKRTPPNERDPSQPPSPISR